jgi:hypothetical protein
MVKMEAGGRYGASWSMGFACVTSMKMITLTATRVRIST